MNSKFIILILLNFCLLKPAYSHLCLDLGHQIEFVVPETLDFDSQGNRMHSHTVFRHGKEWLDAIYGELVNASEGDSISQLLTKKWLPTNMWGGVWVFPWKQDLAENREVFREGSFLITINIALKPGFKWFDINNPSHIEHWRDWKSTKYLYAKEEDRPKSQFPGEVKKEMFNVLSNGIQIPSHSEYYREFQLAGILVDSKETAVADHKMPASVIYNFESVSYIEVKIGNSTETEAFHVSP